MKGDSFQQFKTLIGSFPMHRITVVVVHVWTGLIKGS